jgi:hypothetical protein
MDGSNAQAIMTSPGLEDLIHKTRLKLLTSWTDTLPSSITVMTSTTTEEFRYAMSHTFGPVLCWIPSFEISDSIDHIPPLLNYHAPDGHHCAHCNGYLHEAYRCYMKDPRNMYRYPPNKGWPNGDIPVQYLLLYKTPTPLV